MVLGTQVDLIKLDVEGGEASALVGARDVINRCRPTLALSAYHKPDDLWELPRLINTITDGYSFFLRQHYFNSFDVVLYAVPGEKA